MNDDFNLIDEFQVPIRVRQIKSDGAESLHKQPTLRVALERCQTRSSRVFAEYFTAPVRFGRRCPASYRRLVVKGLLGLIAMAFWLLMAGPAQAQTQCPEPGQVKYLQPPNIDGGLAVFDSGPWVLADDFICTNTGPILDIHLWGSWLNDSVDLNTTFWLGIYDDVAAVTNGPVITPSHPGTNLIWQQWFGPGQYLQSFWQAGIEQFLDPGPPAIMGNDSKAYYYCFYPTNPPTQTGTLNQSKIYWLAVYALPSEGQANAFGWKSSTVQRFDISVHTQWPGGPPPATTIWQPTRDPNNQAIDLAFKIVTATNPPPPECCPETNGVKYVQIPKVIQGMDVNASQNLILADDFPCHDTGPIADIRLWGSWLKDEIDPNAVFKLSIWSDVPAQTNGANPHPSHPGIQLWAQSFGPGQYHQCVYTNVSEPFYDASVPAILGDDTVIHYLCFQPTDPFVQRGTAAAPTNYWLAVNVQTTAGSGLYFGWHNSSDYYNDIAVWGNAPAPAIWTPMADPSGIPLSMAFKIITASNPCPPLVLTCVTNKTVECGPNWNFDPPTVTDPCCSNSYTLSYSDVTNGICPRTITRTWMVTDCKGATASCSQTVTVVDTLPPVIICPPARTVECGSTWTFDNPTASDNCCTNVTIAVLAEYNDSNGPCYQYHTRVWVATDCCGNTNTCSQTITVVDTTPPVITCASNKVVQCGIPGGFSFDPPAAYDACCGTNVTITVVSTVTNGICPQTITRTWAAVDCCGNRATCSQTVTLVDTTPPVIVCVTNKIVECGSTWTFDPPGVSDNCCTNVTLFVLKTVTNGVCPQILTRTWVAADCCGNTNTCSQTVTVVDTTPPIINCVTNLTIPCGQPWEFATPSAYDNCCSNVAVFPLRTVTNGVCPQLITRTWAAVDCCNNTNTCSQTITIVNLTPPTITCATNKTVECGTNWAFDPPTAFSPCCGTNVTISVLATVTNAQGPCYAYYTRTWVATDCCGNTNTCSQTVTVADTTPPVVTCPSNKIVQCGSPWTFDPPTAFDACCGTNVTITVTSTVTNGVCPQNLTRTWAITDCCNNRTLCSQTVTVVDTTPPVIVCPSNLVVYTCATNVSVTWTISASDACDPAVTVVSTPPSGTLFARGTTNIVHVVATDACGNTNTCNFTVTVLPPVLTYTYDRSAHTMTLYWSGAILQEAPTVIGPWSDVPGATSPWTVPTVGPHKFYRLRCP